MAVTRSMSKPKNWPNALPYLSQPQHAKEVTEEQLLILHSKPKPFSIPRITSQQTLTPCQLVKIQAIKDSSHPASGQFGLFATQNLKPGTFILPYLGRVHPSSATDSTSDYDIWLDRETDLAVDAARSGNEGRFVNDYRGISTKANAEFETVWCERWGELCIGIWVLGGKKAEGIKKGTEILVSYGKGFWGNRRGDDTG